MNKGGWCGHCTPGGLKECPEGNQGLLAFLGVKESWVLEMTPLPLFPY